MQNDRDILLVSVFTFLTVILWIVFELFKTTQTSTVTANVQQLLTPLSSSIDVDTLKTLNNRVKY